MRKFNFILVIMALPMLILARVPLQEAIRKAIELNLGVKNAILETRQSELEKKNARFQKWFIARLGGYYLFKSEQMEIKLSDVQLDNGITIPLDPLTVGAKHNYDFVLGLSQPLFTGGLLTSTVNLKNAQVGMHRNQTQISRIDIALRVKESYFQFKLLKAKLDQLNTFIRKLSLHHQKLSDYYQEDLIKKSDLLETETRIQEQLLNREEIENQIKNQQIHFKNLCGIEIQEVVEEYSEEIGGYSESFSNFQSSHPMLLLLNQQKAMVGYQKKMLSGSALPQIAGFAEIHYARPGIDFFSNEWMLYFQGGISLDFSLFDWDIQKRKQKMFDYAIEKLDNQRQDFVRQVKKNLKQLYESKESAEKRLKIIESLIAISEQDIRLKEELLQEQQISNLDYLSTLSTKERYVSMRHAVNIQIELIKININTLIGIVGPAIQEAS